MAGQKAPTSPHSHDAERAVLGAILIDSAGYEVAASILQPRHFFRLVHR